MLPPRVNLVVKITFHIFHKTSFRSQQNNSLFNISLLVIRLSGPSMNWIRIPVLGSYWAIFAKFSLLSMQES